MNRGAIYFIVISVFLTTLGCGNRKSYNPNIVDKNAVNAFRSEYQEIKSVLEQARINLIEESNDEGELIQFRPEPTELSRIPEERIAALEKLIAFNSSSIQKYFGKKHLREKKMQYLVSATTKATFEKSRSQAEALIEHFTAVTHLRLDPRFMEHDEYLKLAGPIIEKLKSLHKTLSENYGVEFAPGLIDNDELMPMAPQLVFNENSFVEAKNAAISATEKNIGELRKTLELLEGRLAVTSINHFVTFGSSHSDRIVPFQEDLKSYKELLRTYKNDLKETVESKLLKQARLKKIDKSADSKNPSIQDLTTYFRVDFKKLYNNSSDELFREVAQAFVNYRDDLSGFIKKYKGETQSRGRVSMTFLNAGETQVLRSGMESAEAWARFFIRSGATNKEERILPFGVLSVESLQPLEKRQIALRTKLNEAGVKIPPGLPLGKFELNGAKYARHIFKTHFRIDVMDKELLQKDPSSLKEFYCFLSQDFLKFLDPMVQNRQQIHINPTLVFSYGNQELQRTKTAISLVAEALRTYDAKPNCKPQED